MLLTLLPDLSVAPLKYAHVHKENGGPIASLQFREREREGEKIFEAFACLDEEKTGLKLEENLIYGNAHGTGTAPEKAAAIFTAISESLERWAWFSAGKDPALRAQLRYDLDSSTTGFAAFPGLGVQGARKRAYFEAAERWAVAAWWEGKIPHISWNGSGVQGVQLKGSIPGAAVVVLWKKSELFTSYGFAASYSPKAAADKALIELHRNIEVLNFYQRERSRIDLSKLTLNEKRLCFFASEMGHALFQERLGRQAKTVLAPKLAVDMGVVGPWTQYAHVWRCLFERDQPPEENKEDYFLF